MADNKSTGGATPTWFLVFGCVLGASGAYFGHLVGTEQGFSGTGVLTCTIAGAGVAVLIVIGLERTLRRKDKP